MSIRTKRCNYRLCTRRSENANEGEINNCFCFCFVSTIIATFIISLLVYFVSPMMGLIETPATMGEIIAIVPDTFISAFMISGISLIPLFLE